MKTVLHDQRRVPDCRFEFVEEGDDLVLYVVFDGKRIAKRYSGDKRWINLEPGYAVHGSEAGNNHGRLEIEYCPVDALPQ